MAIEEKQLEEIKKLVPKLAQEGLFAKKDEHRRLTAFYLELTEESLNSAQLLYKVSTNPALQEATGFFNLKGFLWVINASYYSMFYMANAALASLSIKIKSEVGVHKLTFQVFVYYFYLTNKIIKKFIEDLLAAQEESEELLGREKIAIQAREKAQEMISNLDAERRKRRTFTYELERTKIEIKAKTSLERANSFYREIKNLLK